jgi:predicted RNA-binding Zn-ribbon protein involved in translation (DUF1610 family)
MATDMDQSNLISSAEQMAEYAMKNIYERDISADDFYFLMSQYPFVVVCNSDYAYIDPDDNPKRIRTKNGWTMIIYKDAICLGTNFLEAEKFQYEHGKRGLAAWEDLHFKCPKCGNKDEKALKESGAKNEDIYSCPKCGFKPEQGVKGFGTLSKQAIDAVIEMVEYIRQHKKWSAVEIIVGHYPVQRDTWIICSLFDYPVAGFDPKPEDRVVKNWFDKIRDRILYPPEKPIIYR